MPFHSLHIFYLFFHHFLSPLSKSTLLLVILHLRDSGTWVNLHFRPYMGANIYCNTIIAFLEVLAIYLNSFLLLKSRCFRLFIFIQSFSVYQQVSFVKIYRQYRSTRLEHSLQAAQSDLTIHAFRSCYDRCPQSLADFIPSHLARTMHPTTGDDIKR